MCVGGVNLNCPVDSKFLYWSNISRTYDFAFISEISFAITKQNPGNPWMHLLDEVIKKSMLLKSKMSLANEAMQSAISFLLCFLTKPLIVSKLLSTPVDVSKWTKATYLTSGFSVKYLSTSS